MKEFEYFPRARFPRRARASKSITGFNHRPTFRGRFIKTIRPIPIPSYRPFARARTIPTIARQHGRFVSFRSASTLFVSMIDFLAVRRIIIAMELETGEERNCCSSTMAVVKGLTGLGGRGEGGGRRINDSVGRNSRRMMPRHHFCGFQGGGWMCQPCTVNWDDPLASLYLQSRIEKREMLEQSGIYGRLQHVGGSLQIPVSGLSTKFSNLPLLLIIYK